MQKEEPLELRWLFAVIRRRAWLLIGCILLALVVAFGITSRMPPTYEATTTLMVGPAEEKSTSEYNTLMAGERLALTYGQMLKEPSTLRAAISRLGLDETPETLAKRIKTETVKDTQLVRVTARDSSPGQAALVANTIADIFTVRVKGLQEERYRSYILSKEAEIEAQRKAVEETQSQVNVTGTKKVSDETELTRLQGLLADYRNTDRTRQQDYQSLQLLVERIKDNVKIVETARVPAAAFQFPYTATVTLLVDQSGVDTGSDYSGILASERLAATYAQMVAGPSVLEAASARLGTGLSPDALAASVKAEPIAGTQLVRLQLTGTDAAQTARLANTIAQVFVEQMQEMLAKPYAGRLTRMQDESARLSALIESTQAEIQARTAATLQSEITLTQLQSALAEYRSNYRALQQEYEQIRLSSTQAPGTVVITERAAEPEKPVRNRTLYMLLAALAAMLVALGIAFLIEHLDETIKTPDDVNHALGLNTVGMIEKLEKKDQGLVVALRPQSPAAEAFRMLAANIRLSNIDSHLRTLLVTSPASADGKSAVAANLAVAMANAGLRVVVVDADLRLPRLHQLFGLSQGKGLSDALQSGAVAGALKSTDVPGLRVLTSGMPPPEAVKAISSPNMKTLIAALEKEADIVIIDSPPALAVADTAILTAEVDGVLLVLRAGRTWSVSAQRAMEALRQARTHVIGVVLNAVPVRNNTYYRYYGGSRAYLQRGSLSPHGAGRESAIGAENHGPREEELQPGVTKKKRWLATIPAVILLGALLFMAREPILLAAGDFLVIRDGLRPADVIQVISGPDYRTDYAIQLFKQGYGKQILFTGGWCPQIEGNHAERGEMLAVEQGVPPQNVAADGSEVTSTYAEAVRLREFIDLSATPVRSVIVVSDPYHMRRAQWTYEKVLGDKIAVQMAPVPFDATPYQRRWWQDQASRQYIQEEYLKSFYYLARYQLAFGPVKNWLASMDQE